MRTVHLSVGLARHAAHGWQDPALPDDYAGLQKLVSLPPDQVKRWDLAQLTRLIEMNIGRDLQYIRFNGMVIGGLAGVVLHTVERLFLVD